MAKSNCRIFNLEFGLWRLTEVHHFHLFQLQGEEFPEWVRVSLSISQELFE